MPKLLRKEEGSKMADEPNKVGTDSAAPTVTQPIGGPTTAPTVTQPIGGPTTAPTVTQPIGSPTTVLLIDDQLLVGKMVQRILEEIPGLVFKHCNDPSKAIQTAEEFDPTVILLDLVMPGISGLTLLDEFRRRPATKHVPIVVLSGKEEALTKAEAFSRGANDYLVKLPEVVELVARVRHHSTGYIAFLERNQAMRDLAESQKKLELRTRLLQELFGRFLSDDVVARLLESPTGTRLGGEARVVTIMMSDLRGFTSLSEQLPAESVVRLINNFLGVMTDVILKYNGTIIEFLGDAILAMFGAPIERPNDAANAVACAIEMQVSMERVNQINAASSLPQVEMGIALNTGRVAVGNLGSERRMKYGIVGRHVNLTARIESYSVGRQVLVSESTAAAVGPILLTESQRQVKPKGVAEPITVYQVIGIGGDYNLRIPDQEHSPLFFPPKEVPIRFTVLSEKDAGQRYHDGTLLSFSKKEAEIRSLVRIDVHSNVKLCLTGKDGKEIPGDIYAKVVEQTNSGVRLIFTSLPPAVSCMMDGMLYFEK